MTREELLKECILSKYKSIREFCMQIEVAYSTVDNIFKRGIMGSSVSLIIKICDRLNIDVDELINGRISEKLPPLTALTLRERTLIYAYRNNPSMQSAVNKLLGIEDDSSITHVYRAARSEDNHADEIVDMDSRQIGKFKKAPETDEDLL